MRARLLPAAVLCLLSALPVHADWDPGQEAKWVQRPDLETTGIDIHGTEPYLLADDFQCTQTGFITGIHLWSSWRGDVLPENGPDQLGFILSIHKDIPAEQSPTGYSMPGEVLWWRQFGPGDFTVRPYAEGIEEGWMTPPEDYVFPGDTVCWQYNFRIPEDAAFLQTGTTADPVVYWLDVQARPLTTGTQWGWKTSIDHWNDDAVWGQGEEPFTGPWSELIYPSSHPFGGESIDLAFVLQGTPPPVERDFGDLPDPPYPTLAASSGAAHVINPNLFLGASVDPDPDGQPNAAADGDDTDGNDDEDGVVFTSSLIAGAGATVQVTASAQGRLDGWIDFDGDGVLDAANQIFASVALLPGPNNLNFVVPAGTPAGPTWARFRFSTAGGLGPGGGAPDGEVEDYRVAVEAPELDFGDAPDIPYRTLLATNGARHLVDPAIFLGAAIDTEADGQPSVLADGDDLGGADDEDGVAFLTAIQPGLPADVRVTASVDGVLNTWFDWNQDGDWADPGEQVFVDQALVAGPNVLTFLVPATANLGRVYARFRFNLNGGLSEFGPAPDGEVEDYLIEVTQAETFKWEQLPDLETTGIDIDASYELIVADDFECTASGPLTTIEVWGSWRDDLLPENGNPESVTFTLSIHEDIPAGVAAEWSMPGKVLWARDFQPGTFTAEVFAADLQEGWMTPPDQYEFPGDTVCWLYRFQIPVEEAFFQFGNPDVPVIYWLDVKAVPIDGAGQFGWKTSRQHFNDDATRALGAEPYEGDWRELRYPSVHPFGGESIDQAFRISGPEADVYDFGDAEDGPYPTLLASNGARHVVRLPIFLGQRIDAEADGQPAPNALGDDNGGVDDEDGVVILSPYLQPTQQADFEVTAASAGRLNVWLDMDADGSFAQPGDHIVVDRFLNPGPNVVSAILPATNNASLQTRIRFRFSTVGGLAPDGLAPDGEVEDYRVGLYASPTGADEETLPRRLHLERAVPNPFNPQTLLRYDLPESGLVRLAVYDLHGGLVRVLVEEHKERGSHEVRWDGRDGGGAPVASGVYVIRLDAAHGSRSVKATLVR